MIKLSYAAYFGAKTTRAQKDVRYYLNAILIDKAGFVVATDGHRLFCATAETDIEEDMLVDVKGKEPAKFDNVEFDVTTLRAKFFAARDVLVAELPIELVDGRFPDWRRVANYSEGKVDCIRVDLQYMANAAKIMKAYGGRHAKLEFQDTSKAMRITFNDSAYLMLSLVELSNKKPA